MDKLQKAIEQLNLENADAVALFLRDQGYKGHVGKQKACPVANYLHMATGNKELRVINTKVVKDSRKVDWPEIWWILKNPTYLRDLGRHPSWIFTNMIDKNIVDLPSSVVAFIELFDDGEYPDLEIK